MKFDYPDDYYKSINYGSLYHEDLLELLHKCESTCEQMATFIKNKYPKRVLQLMVLRDCANMCALTANYIADQSQFARASAKLCADICYRCGIECSKYPDKESQECSKICLHGAREYQAFVMEY